MEILPLPVGVSLPVQDEMAVPSYVELAVLAENEGYHTVFFGEIAGGEAMVTLGAIAQATRRIRLSPGVVSIYTRGAVLTGMGFASLASLAPGRIAMGIGTGSHMIVEGWNGRRLEAPLETMRETIEVLRQIVRGNRVLFHGERVNVAPYRLHLPSPEPLPVIVGPFNPQMTRLAGELADGVLLAWAPLDELAERVALVHEGAARAGRDPETVEIGLYVQAYAGPRVADAIERFRRLVLEYAIRPTHRAAFVGSFPAIDHATALWEAGKRAEALALVPDEAVHRLAPIGDAGLVVDRLEEVRQLGVTLPVLYAQSLDRSDPTTSADTIAAVAEEYRRRFPPERSTR
ncbi:MAG: LLM class flavin-dependent oxidoreductase [Actinobacteria bacterium]|nr:LLM class flavin-dependent oxidoreductase [Actinomycetota bacterium]